MKLNDFIVDFLQKYDFISGTPRENVVTHLYSIAETIWQFL